MSLRLTRVCFFALALVSVGSIANAAPPTMSGAEPTTPAAGPAGNATPAKHAHFLWVGGTVFRAPNGDRVFVPNASNKAFSTANGAARRVLYIGREGDTRWTHVDRVADLLKGADSRAANWHVTPSRDVGVLSTLHAPREPVYTAVTGGVAKGVSRHDAVQLLETSPASREAAADELRRTMPDRPTNPRFAADAPKGEATGPEEQPARATRSTFMTKLRAFARSARAADRERGGAGMGAKGATAKAGVAARAGWSSTGEKTRTATR